MIKNILLTLLCGTLLLPFVAQDSHGAATNTFLCWDGNYWTGVDGTACPAELTGASGGSEISDTTANVSVTSTTDSGTLYACVKATASAGVCPTAPTRAQFIAGTGDGFICGTPDATPVVGTNEIAVTGLTASDEYCSYNLQIDDQGRPSANNTSIATYIATSSAWSTLSGAPETGPGADLETLNAIFAGAGGSDSNACTSHATRCLTVAGAWGKTHTAGQDIYFLSGSTFSDGSTSRGVTWAGSADDRVVIGCYYLDSANSNQATNCHEGAGADAQTKPIIKGSIETCSATYTCVYTGVIYTPKIHVRRDYVTVSDLDIRYVSGRGLMFEGDQDPDGSVVYGRAERINIYVAGDNGILLQDAARHIVVRDSVIDRAAECQRQGQNGGSCVYSYPAMISVSRVANADNLIENNTVRNAWGEGIGVYESSFVVVRGNRTADVRSASMYCGACSDAVFESNINLRQDEWNPAQDYVNGHWSNAVETGRNNSSYVGYYMDNVVFRNNIGIDRGHCLSAGKSDTVVAPQWSMDFHAYGNTCVAPATSLINNKNPTAYVPFAATIKSNAFYNVPDSMITCELSAAGTQDYNAWGVDPEGTNCNGANDQIGTGFEYVYTDRADWRAIDIEQIDPEDVRPGIGSILLGTGDPSLETTTVLTASEFPILSEANYPYVPNTTNWEKALYYDYYGNARSATVPNIGAIEGAAP